MLIAFACSAALLAHTLISWRVSGRRQRAYKRRADVLTDRLVRVCNDAEAWRVAAKAFDANQAAWRQAIDRPWWQRDPIDAEDT